MPQTLGAGDELSAEGGHHRAVVKLRTVKHLDGGAGGIGERDGLLDASCVGLDLRDRLDADAGGLQRLGNPKQRRPVPDLPSDGDDFVGVTGDHDYARGTFVHAEVEGGFIRATTGREAEHVEGEGAPPVDVVGLNLDVAETLDVAHCVVLVLSQIIAANGPSGSMPSELSAEAWKVVPGTWIAWASPACASRQ